jgi:hypothetical protein
MGSVNISKPDTLFLPSFGGDGVVDGDVIMFAGPVGNYETLTILQGKDKMKYGNQTETLTRFSVIQADVRSLDRYQGIYRLEVRGWSTNGSV